MSDVFIVLDAVRYDVFDNQNFERLPDNALKTYSPSCWTGGSFFTYFSGLSPIRAEPFVFDPGLESKPDWLPKLIRDEGIFTEFYTGSGWLKLHKHTFARGFAETDMQVNQKRLGEFVKKWIPPEEDEFWSVFHVLETHNPVFDGESHHQLIKDFDHNWDLMADSLHYVDRQLATLFNKLPEGTRVTLAADHGEAFGENGSWGHSPRQSPAKQEMIGGSYRLEGSPDKVFEVPYAVGDKVGGEVVWRDSDEVRLE